MNVGSDAIGAVASRKASSLREIVQSEVERMILDGDLAAGERLNEQKLASQLGVSRGPVREALRALERSGLVTGVVNLGVFVRQVGVEEAVEIYEMRGVVFGFACARLAEKITPGQEGTLAGLVGEMDAAIAAQDPSIYYKSNLRLHDMVMEFAGHGRAAAIYQSLIKESHLLRERSLQPLESMQASNCEHKVILAAIVSGDADAARTAAENHHFKGKRRWLNTLGAQHDRLLGPDSGGIGPGRQ